MQSNTQEQITNKAIELVKTKISGHRKGLPDVPAYEHSLRVREIIKSEAGTDFDTHVAALLHDIVEDGRVSLDELRNMSFSEKTVNLIDLCSHDLSIVDPNARWVNMVARLANKDNSDAWLIKLADIYDNLHESYMLSPDRRRFMVETKAPLLLVLTQEKLGNTKLWQKLMDKSTKLREEDKA